MAATTADLKIIVVGSGLGGLAAAIGLELAGFDYIVLEESSSQVHQATDTIDVGGAVQVGPTALHFLNQLGIYEEIQKISKPISGYSMNEHDMNYIGRIDLSTHRERYGYHTEVMSRAQLHRLLLQRIPPKRIVQGKVLGMIQNREKVTVRCSDGTIHEGQVLIGADGAFSNIRHTLYWTLEEKKKLPKADTVPMSVDLHIISGCTKPLDPLKYPVLLDAMSEIQSVQLPSLPYTIWFMPLLDNRIAWDITHDVPKTAIRQGEASKVNLWRPEHIQEVFDAVRDFDCPYGGQISDLLETTDEESMYMHMSEERFCETWAYGRTVLLGDACHKGFYMPASEAIVDAVTLVNLLVNMKTESLTDMAIAFRDYKERRAPGTKAAVEQSALLRQVFSGKGRAASLKRNVVFNYMPEKVRNLLEDKKHEYRPQLWFLPQVKDKGIVRPIPNMPPTTEPQGSTQPKTSQEVASARTSSSSPSTNGSATTNTTATTSATTVAMSPVSSTASSPRNSRASWSSAISGTRPAFTVMSSAPSVSLFGAASTNSKASQALPAKQQAPVKSTVAVATVGTTVALPATAVENPWSETEEAKDSGSDKEDEEKDDKETEVFFDMADEDEEDLTPAKDTQGSLRTLAVKDNDDSAVVSIAATAMDPHGTETVIATVSTTGDSQEQDTASTVATVSVKVDSIVKEEEVQEAVTSVPK